MCFEFEKLTSNKQSEVKQGISIYHEGLKKFIDVPLIVGGGIRTREQAAAAAQAGADIVVTGNLIEAVDNKKRIAEVIEGIKQKKQ